MTSRRCSVCGVAPAHDHHVSGRSAPGGVYLDRTLMVGLCPRHHAAVHVVLRALGAEFGGGLAHRVGRLAAHVTWLADREVGLALTPASTRSLGALLLEAADALREEGR